MGGGLPAVSGSYCIVEKPEFSENIGSCICSASLSSLRVKTLYYMKKMWEVKGKTGLQKQFSGGNTSIVEGILEILGKTCQQGMLERIN